MPNIAGASRQIVGAFYDKGAAVWHAGHPDFGLLFNGTDETAGWTAMLAVIMAAGGGTLYMPIGRTLRIDGAWIVPNDGGATPKQYPLRITTAGSASHAGQTG